MVVIVSDFCGFRKIDTSQKAETVEEGFRKIDKSQKAETVEEGS